MKGFVCKMCGYISINGSAPEACPACGAPKKAFEEKEDAIVTPSDATEKLEANKKHIPSIAVEKKCSFIPDKCSDVHIKVGETTHPMLAEHHIKYIDCYISKEFVARIKLTPEKLNPAGCLHLRVSTGKFTAIERCNLHGAWISEVDL